MLPKLALLSGLVVTAACMVLHEAPPPLYPPVRHREPARNYGFAYQVSDARTGDFKGQREASVGGTILGQYSLLQPDGLTRTVEYRADDDTGFNAVVNNVGRAYDVTSGSEAAGGRGGGSARERHLQQSNERQSTPRPLTLERTALIHHVLRQYRHAV